jgi:hypothetical protein
MDGDTQALEQESALVHLLVVPVNCDQVDKLGVAAHRSFFAWTRSKGFARLPYRLVSEQYRASARDSSAAPPDRRSPTLRQAPKTDPGGSTPVGLALCRVGRLAIRVVDPEGLHRPGLASQGLSTLLDLEDSPRQSGTAVGAKASSRIDSYDEP